MYPLRNHPATANSRSCQPPSLVPVLLLWSLGHASHNICLAFFRSVGLTGRYANSSPLPSVLLRFGTNFWLGPLPLHPPSHTRTYTPQALPETSISVSNSVAAYETASSRIYPSICYGNEGASSSISNVDR
jgi:hypothetical protein